MQTPVMVPGFTTGPSTSAIRYSPLYGGAGAANWTTSANNAGTPIPVAGTFSMLFARFPTLGAGSYIITIMKNGVAQTLTCTVNTAGTGLASDVVNSFTVAAGDLVAIRCDPNGTTPTANTSVQISMLFTATTTGESMILGGYVGGLSAGSLFLVFGANDNDSTAAAAAQVMPTAGVIDHLYFRLSAAPGGTATRTLTVLKNGSATGVTCTVTSAAVIASDLTNSISVVAGDLITVQETNANTPATTLFGFGVRFVPTTSGESVLLSRWSSSPAASTNRFNNAGGSANGSVSAEANVLSIAPVPFVMKNLNVSVVTAPGGVTTRDYFFRLNSASSALTTQLTGAATTGSDTSHSINVVANDTLDTMVTSSASVAATAQMRTSMVAFIGAAPPPSGTSYLPLLGVG